MVAAAATFAGRLAQAIRTSDSLLCLGLDPDGAVDVSAAERQCHVLLDATLEHVCAVKPNLAFFEQYGSAGYALLERLRPAIPAGTLLILDAKRGDVGNTAQAYVRALYDVLGADVVTVNALLGHDSVAPWLTRPGHGVFIVARTSNPGAADFLDHPAGPDGATLYQRIVDVAQGWDPDGGTIGFVVGATAAEAVADVRRRAPSAPLLLPGVGAQGGDLEAAVRAGLDAAGGGAVVPVSRGISAAADPGLAARELRDRIAAVRAAA
ncbi:MAG TPA: orotidine-5'-phosphate decarboxylase [Candidatus Dormibacteraeota bacterium]|nr:orotidine-5'-phosphate decarboxylase [Candidatus Dormibacteraeota bacterium]